MQAERAEEVPQGGRSVVGAGVGVGVGVTCLPVSGTWYGLYASPLTSIPRCAFLWLGNAGNGEGGGAEGGEAQPIRRLADAHNPIRPGHEGPGLEQQAVYEKR